MGWLLPLAALLDLYALPCIASTTWPLLPSILIVRPPCAHAIRVPYAQTVTLGDVDVQPRQFAAIALADWQRDHPKGGAYLLEAEWAAGWFEWIDVRASSRHL